jgi:hypothetical protein
MLHLEHFAEYSWRPFVIRKTRTTPSKHSHVSGSVQHGDTLDSGVSAFTPARNALVIFIAYLASHTQDPAETHAPLDFRTIARPSQQPCNRVMTPLHVRRPRRSTDRVERQRCPCRHSVSPTPPQTASLRGCRGIGECDSPCACPLVLALYLRHRLSRLLE